MLVLSMAIISFAVSQETEMATNFSMDNSLVKYLGADPVLSCP